MCSYETTQNNLFIRHTKGKKHTRLEKERQIAINKKANMDQHKCPYCPNVYAHNRTRTRHIKMCKTKKDLDSTNTIDSLKKELHEAKEQIKQHEEDKLKRDRELLDYFKSMKMHQGNQYNVGNMYFINNNFHNAYNFDDLMSKDLTEDEIEYIHENGATAGAAKLLSNRCESGISLHMRPYHCIDDSRSKYMLRVDDTWKIDKKAEKIVRTASNKVEEAYPEIKNPNLINFDNEQQVEKYNKCIQGMIDLRGINRGKVIDELNRRTNLKNLIA
jgi:hypothetical protein